MSLAHVPVPSWARTKSAWLGASTVHTLASLTRCLLSKSAAERRALSRSALNSATSSVEAPRISGATPAATKRKGLRSPCQQSHRRQTSGSFSDAAKEPTT